jgi:hypothetical protein
LHPERIAPALAAFALTILTPLELAAQAPVRLPDQPGTVPDERPPFPPKRATVPLAPIAIAPVSGVARGSAYGAGLALSWAQGGASLARPPAAQHFVVCIGPAAAAGACAWPGQYNMPVASVPSTAYVHPQFGQQPGVRAYTWRLPGAATANLLDRDLAWSVGACTSTSTATCSFSARRDLYWSTRNLTKPDFQNVRRTSGSATGGMTMSITGDNAGDSATGPFRVSVQFLEALTDGRTQRCIEDVNAAGLADTDLVIFRSGASQELWSLPRDGAGRRVAPGVAGISRPPQAMPPTDVSVSDVPANTATAMLAQNVGFSFSWGSPPAPYKRFIGVIKLDANDDVREWDESDNGKGECLDAVTRT